MKSFRAEINYLYHVDNHAINAYAGPMAIVAAELEAQSIWEERVKDTIIEEIEEW